MNITILASIWAENLWDELILKNEIILLEKQFASKKPVFAVFSYDTKNIFYKKNNIEYLEYFPIWIRKIKNIFRNIKNFWTFIKTIIVSDLVVIWWGWIFFDNEIGGKNSNLFWWNFRTKIIRFFKKNILFWWVWINISDKKNLKKLKKIFSWAYNVTVRDEYSKEILDKIWIKSKIIKDPVFFDNLEKETSPQPSPTGEGVDTKLEKNKFLVFWKDYKDFDLDSLKNLDFSWKNVWIAFRRWFLSEEKIEKLIKIILEKNWKIILIPHSFHKTDDFSNDCVFLKKFAQKFELKICKNMTESYEIYTQKKIDFNFASRLHSIILSEVYNIDYIGISYTKKTENLLMDLEK